MICEYCGRGDTVNRSGHCWRCGGVSTPKHEETISPDAVKQFAGAVAAGTIAGEDWNWNSKPRQLTMAADEETVREFDRRTNETRTK